MTCTCTPMSTCAECAEKMMSELPPLPAYAHDLRPRWPGDIGGYTADQMRAYAAAAVAKERERCAQLCEKLHDDWSASRSYDTGDSPGGKDCAAAIRATQATPQLPAVS